MTLFNEAYHFALKKHKGQLRLDGQDYFFNHLLKVVERVTEEIDSPDNQILCTVAILHDTIEDTDTTYEQLQAIFGKVVADSVSLLSKPENMPYTKYVNNIKQSGDQYAIKVKIADLKDNLSTIHNVPDQEKRYRLKTRYEKALKELTT